MDGVFFEQLELPDAKYNLDAGSGTHAEQTGKILIGVENFAPTEKAKENLLKEGVDETKVFVTGNTIVDAVYQNLEIAERKVNVLKELNLKPKEYFLVTAHRQENVDAKTRLKGILNGLKLLSKEFSTPVIFPVHPRTQKRIGEFGLETDGVELINPLGFLEFLQLEASAKLVLTDSGGVQEKTCIQTLGKFDQTAPLNDEWANPF
jgi:UDP-N-acetylglucosamine 2-epimerase (non-hydrolysing)